MKKTRLWVTFCACQLVLSPSIQAAPIATSYTIEVLGLTDAEHTRNDGYRYSDAGLLNEAGLVAGRAERYNGTGTSLGYSAWLYNGTTTLNIGLTGSTYTRNDGFQYSTVSRLNEAGQVAGWAERYNGDA